LKYSYKNKQYELKTAKRIQKIYRLSPQFGDFPISQYRDVENREPWEVIKWSGWGWHHRRGWYCKRFRKKLYNARARYNKFLVNGNHYRKIRRREILRGEVYEDFPYPFIFFVFTIYQFIYYNVIIRRRMHMRIGELVAIKKTDILDNSLLVERSRRRKQLLNDDFTFTKPMYEIEDRIKGNKVKGGRKINLPSKAREIALRAIELYPEGEYLFMKNGEPIKGHAFNRYLKIICDKLNITYLPSHQIRFTNATALAEAGVKVNQLSHDLLHSQISTTYRYIRQREMDDESKAIASEVLNM